MSEARIRAQGLRRQIADDRFICLRTKIEAGERLWQIEGQNGDYKHCITLSNAAMQAIIQMYPQITNSEPRPAPVMEWCAILERTDRGT